MSSEPCPACGSRVNRISYDVPDHEYLVNFIARYAACGDCGTLYQIPMPDSCTLTTFYPKTYHSFATTGVLAKVRHSLRLRRLLRLLNKDTGVVLDYGCGSGSFIRWASARAPGISFWGYEVADRPRTETRGGVTVVTGGVEHLMNELPPCDLVTMNHVIEHLPDPRSILSALHERMIAGAILEGQTPAADSFERKVFGTRWSGFHAPRHTVVFSRVGLTHLMTAARFKSVEVIGAFNPAAIGVSLAATMHRSALRPIRRSGVLWLMYLASATALYPLDVISGAPGIVNFTAIKNA
jgi:SAM-dependent methyltransferase